MVIVVVIVSVAAAGADMVLAVPTPFLEVDTRQGRARIVRSTKHSKSNRSKLSS